MEEPLPKLSWFPLYVEKILSSSSWLQMKDYQRGWYIQLLLLSAHSVRPGYLPLDGSLWRLAGARTKQYFEQESVVVMACFKRRQMDGREWIYNERLVRVLEQQARRQMDFDRRGKKGSGKDDQRQTSLSFSSSTISISPDLIQKTVEELFEYYCNTFTRDPRYKLTESRRMACAHRLMELAEENGGDFDVAKQAGMQAIGNLSRSEFHVAHGYCDWLDHIFKSPEVFQKRLDMRSSPVVLQPGTRAGFFADPEFGKNEDLDRWLSSGVQDTQVLKRAQSERDPIPPERHRVING
ncbi:MAG: hypothetical protein LAN64_06765 [Acidobacteriia bacterium]|nr:hypothetical protein [Terriglobia bacterium]